MRRIARLPVLGVDLGSALDLVGGVLKWLGLAFIFPAALALGYGESAWPFLAAGAITTAVGWVLDWLTGEKTGELVGPREGFLVVALVWLFVPAFGALPFLFAETPQLSNPIDAYFEAVSGFTASGATVLVEIEALDRSMLMWRQFSHWLGGMGIIVLAVAILPRLRIGGRQLLQSELAGPTEIERLSATIRSTARRLWTFYVGLTAVAALVLAILGWSGADSEMDLYQAVAQSFSAIALGGFSTKDGSIGAFAPITQWAVLIFIVLAGINFLRLFRLFVQRQIRVVARDEEVRLYGGFLLIGSLLLIIAIFVGDLASSESGVRNALFQAASIMTTTGFATADYTQWGALASFTLLALMFIGASAGSTGGSIKVVRHLLLFRIARREIEQTVHREAVVPVRLSGAVVDERALRSVATFVLLYLLTFAIGSMLLVIDAQRVDLGLSAFEAIGAAAATLGNVGPSFGFSGPFGSYEPFSDFSTGVLIGLMWLGRLEILPVAVLLTRSYWRG